MAYGEPIVRIKDGKAVIIPSAKAAAEAKGCTVTRIYQLLKGDKPDSDGATFMHQRDYEAKYRISAEAVEDSRAAAREEPKRRLPSIIMLEGVSGGVSNTPAMQRFTRACKEELETHFSSIELEFKSDRAVDGDAVTVIVQAQLCKGSTYLSDYDYLAAKGWGYSEPWKDPARYVAVQKSKEFSLEGLR